MSTKPVDIPDARPRPRTTTPPGGCPGRILIVDDEALVRTVTRRVLESRGYVVAVAARGRDGLDVIERERGEFDVVILDMAMPFMAGPEMFRLARARYPALRVRLASGFTSSEDA